MAGTAVVNKAAMEYFDAITANGAFVVDATGRGDINPALAEVIKAFHEVLAGGAVRIQTVTAGAPAIVSDLNAKKDAALASLNVPSAGGGPIVFSP